MKRNTRREELSQQEKLILQRKKEIELKLNQMNDNELNDTQSSCTDPQLNDIPLTPSSSKCDPITTNAPSFDRNPSAAQDTKPSGLNLNKFKNDGSFFAQFMEMQKHKDSHKNMQTNDIKVKEEPTDTCIKEEPIESNSNKKDSKSLDKISFSLASNQASYVLIIMC